VSIIFLVGLTGAGKSTVLPDLLAGAGRLLPDRRELTDTVILPAALMLDGQPPRPVPDRLERFRLTARYRREHPEGVVHALREYLAGQPLDPADVHGAVFDGLRGEVEVRAAAARFPAARFLMLEASATTRVRRLAGRSDDFDRAGEDARALERAERIVAEEQLHYDQAGARRFLESLPSHRRLIVETDSLPLEQVAAAVAAWSVTGAP
jgi:hypothetical protein